MRKVALAVVVLALTSACRASSEIRPAFTKEKAAPKGELSGYIVYTGRQGSRSQVYGVDASGDGPVTDLTPAKVEERSPAISPDGKLLATAVVNGGRKNGIYIQDLKTGERRAIVSGPGDFDSPSWSGDGKQVAYAFVGRGPDDHWQLYLTDAEGKAPRRLTNDSAQDWSPTLSPDGNWIAYVSDRDGDNALWLYKVSSGATTKIVDSKRSDEHPAFSADGSRIVFSSDRERGVWQIFAVDTLTGKQSRVVRTNAADRYPSFSPDGRYVLVSDGYLAVYRADGSKLANGVDRWRLGRRLALSASWSDKADAPTGSGV